MGRINHLNPDTQKIQEIIDDLQERLNNGEIAELFVVDFDKENNWSFQCSGNSSSTAIAASILQSKFYQYHFW